MTTPSDPKRPVPQPPAKPAAGPPAPRPAAPGQPAPRPAAPGQTAGGPAAPRPQAPAQPGAPRPPAPAAGAPRPQAPAQPGAAPKPPVAGAPPAPKPAAPAAPAATKPAAPAAPAPAAPKPPVPAAKAPPPAPKPEPKPKPKNRFAYVDSGTRQLGQKLVDLGFLDDAQLDSLLEEMQTDEEAKLGVLATKRNLVNEEQLLQATAEIHGLKVVNLEEVQTDTNAVKIVPKNMAELYKIVPLTYADNILTIALSDPSGLQALDDIRNFLNIQQVTAVLAPPKAVDTLLGKAYSGSVGQEESIASIIESLEADPDVAKMSGKRDTSIDLDDLQEIANSSPVRKLINMVLLMAIRDRASDIHFEPFEEEYKMRYKCDGVLYEMVPPPRHLAAAIASRIKVMSNLDIAERRLPQDGRIELNVGGNRIDMRVSILPTLFGESTVIRVLDKSSVGLQLDRIGMPLDLLTSFRSAIKKPNGIVLVTGPTGSGKTTTLYSALNELNEIDTKIITTEDPVEYEIEGLIQCQIQTEIDLTFASALRAILRQDPDVILVGEIRDLETAQIAIQASLTGHLVFSTLHTNDAPSSVTRLRDMGVEPFLITATVEAIEAQRLVRRICTNCKVPYEPTREQVIELNVAPESMKGKKFYYGEGCDKCNNLGFKGRTGVYELLMMNDDIRDMISKGCSTDQLRAYCRKIGVNSLRENGINCLLAGTTTLDEIVRETVMED